VKITAPEPEQVRIPLPDGYVSYKTNTLVFSKPSPDPLDGLGCSFTMGLGHVFVVVPADAKPGDVTDTLRRLADDIEHDEPIRSLQLPAL
jgi:hypothetical protein